MSNLDGCCRHCQTYVQFLDYATTATIPFTTQEYLCSGTQGSIYRVTTPCYPDSLILKIVPDTPLARRESIVHAKVTEDMVAGKIPPNLFPWLFKSWIEPCESESNAYMLMSCCEGCTLHDYPIASEPSLETFWINVLTRVSTAVDYLESQGVNHNDILFKNVIYDPSQSQTSVIDLGSVSADDFLIGKDLNHFIYILLTLLNPDDPNSLFPLSIASVLRPLLTVNPYTSAQELDETDFEYGLRLHSGVPSPSTSGGEILKVLGKWVSVTNTSSLNSAMSAKDPKSHTKTGDYFVGMLIGDAMGMPLHLDSKNFINVRFLEDSGRFAGLYRDSKFDAGTMTETCHLALLIHRHFSYNGGRFIPTVMKDATLDYWRLKSTTIADPDTIAYFKRGRKFPLSPYCLVRYLPLVLFHEENPLQLLFQDILKVATLFEDGSEAGHWACLVGAIVWNLRKQHPIENSGGTAERALVQAFDNSLKAVNGNLDPSQTGAVKTFSHVNSAGLQKSMTIADCLKNALWCVYNTTTYDDAIIKSVNIVKGYTATVGALAGVFSTAIGRPIPADWITAFRSKNTNNVVWNGMSSHNYDYFL